MAEGVAKIAKNVNLEEMKMLKKLDDMHTSIDAIKVNTKKTNIMSADNQEVLSAVQAVMNVKLADGRRRRA